MKKVFLTFLTVLAGALPSKAFADGDGRCFDGPDFKFEWKWCSPSSLMDKPVASACFGQLIYTDIIYKAVQLEIRQAGTTRYECLFGRGQWRESRLENCQRAIERDYTAAFGSPRTTKITECLENGLVKWISGKSFDGHSFTSRPQ